MPTKEKWHTFFWFVFVHFVYSSVTVDTVVKFQPIRRRFLDWRGQSKWTVSSVCPQLLWWPRSCQTRTYMNAQFVIMQYSLRVCTQIFPPTRNHRIRDDIAVASIWTSTTYLIMSNLISSKVHKPLSRTHANTRPLSINCCCCLHSAKTAFGTSCLSDNPACALTNHRACSSPSVFIEQSGSRADRAVSEGKWHVYYTYTQHIHIPLLRE